MKTKFGTKLLSLLLCVCMLIPMFTACGNKDKDDDNKPLSWEATAEQVIPLEMEVQNGESNTKLVLSYGEDIFSSIENDQIKLTVYQKAASSDETAESTESSITERTPTDFTASVTNAKQLTITVPSVENDWGYLVAVHSSAISSGKFGEAYGFNHEVIEEYISYSATISGEYATGDVNPVITVTLENTVAAAGLTKEMITLTGLFEGLEITSVSGSESSITIVTSGTVVAATPFFAGVELAEGATNSGVELTADCEVAYRSAYVKQDSFALASGVLTFDAVIVSDTVTLAVNDTLTADGITYTVKAVSEDKTTVTLGVATTAPDLDSAIAEINGKTLEIPANKTASANAHTLTIYAISASVGGSVDYIEETATANTYSATAILFVKNGVWNGTLTTSDITLGGDFDGATVTSVAKDGDSYEIVFTFVKEGLDLDDISLEGTATIAEGKVKNAWGTALDENDADLIYVTGLDRAQTTWEVITAYLEAHKGTFENIKTIGSVATTATSVLNGVVTILQLAGVMESTDSRLDDISQQIEVVDQEIKDLDAKVSRLSQAITVSNSTIIDKTDYNIYLTASNGWNNFKGTYVASLETIVEKYSIAYNAYILNWISKANEEGIDVYLVERSVPKTDKDGKPVYEGGKQVYETVIEVTLPHPLFSSSNQYAVDGEKIIGIGTYRLENSLDNIVSKIMKNKGALYDGYWDDISKGDNTVVAISGDEITFENYLDAVKLAAALHALNTVGAGEILGAYKNFCNAFTGQNGGISMKPLDYYYTMVSSYYNFYGEAKNDIENVHSWIGTLLLKYSGIATLAATYTIGADASTINTYYNKVLNELKQNTGAQTSEHYTYVSGAVLDATKLYLPYTAYRAYVDGYNEEIQVARKTWLNNSTEENYQKLHELLDKKDNVPQKLMSSTDILVMMERYKRLYKAGVTTAATFEDYLVTLKIFDESEAKSLSNMRIVTDPSYFYSKNIPFNNSVTVIVKSISESTWVKIGDTVKVGKNGDLSTEYFLTRQMLSSDVIDLKGNITTDYVLTAYASYYESHWYWSTDEIWTAYKQHNGPVYAFGLS